MRRHISMEQLARDVLGQAAQAEQVKVAAERAPQKLETEVGNLLTKVAAELRTAAVDSLTYDDVRSAAEVRLGKR